MYTLRPAEVRGKCVRATAGVAGPGVEAVGHTHGAAARRVRPFRDGSARRGAGVQFDRPHRDGQASLQAEARRRRERSRSRRPVGGRRGPTLSAADLGKIA